MLQSELLDLQRDLRATLRAYASRLEIQLAEDAALVASCKDAEELPREQLHQIRELTTIVRNRRLKPEKGRRKDLRTLDLLIEEVQSFIQNGRSHGK